MRCRAGRQRYGPEADVWLGAVVVVVHRAWLGPVGGVGCHSVAGGVGLLWLPGTWFHAALRYPPLLCPSCVVSV